MQDSLSIVQTDFVELKKAQQVNKFVEKFIRITK